MTIVCGGAGLECLHSLLYSKWRPKSRKCILILLSPRRRLTSSRAANRPKLSLKETNIPFILELSLSGRGTLDVQWRIRHQRPPLLSQVYSIKFVSVTFLRWIVLMRMITIHSGTESSFCFNFISSFYHAQPRSFTAPARHHSLPLMAIDLRFLDRM